MAKNERVYMSKDAAGIAPKFVPNQNLMARDDSGGPDYDPHTGQFGDGGFVIGEKPHLGVSGGSEDAMEGTEISDKPRTRGYDNISGVPHIGGKDTARAKKEAKE